MSEPLAYDRKTAAEICGVSEDTISRAIASGALEARAVSRDKNDKTTKTLITRRALEAWLEALPSA